LAAANDDAIGGTSVAPNFTVCGLTPGNTYYMMHDGFDFTAGNYSISIYEIVLNAGVEGEVLDLCYGDTANLFLGIANYQLGGTWTQTTPTLGLNNNLFNTLGLAAALYQFTYTVQDGCASDAAHAYVQLYNAPNAGVGSTLNACLNEPINLLDGLSGIVDMTGSWSTAAGPIASPAITTSNTGGSYNYTYTASNGVCPDETATVVVVVDAGCDYTAGIGNTEFVYEVYPNPTSGQLTIVVPANTSAQVRLTDLNGKTLLDIQSQTAATVLDLGQFATGVYMLQIQVGSNRVTERIIKQ
jgi:hypothetical protein